MPDQLCLSLWLRQAQQEAMLDRFGRLLARFPFSRLQPGISALRVYAIELQEPAALEQLYTGDADIDHIITLCREFEHADCAYLVEGWWDLWNYEESWQLKPSPVSLWCFGPEFDNGTGDHFRLELGPETAFLPIAGAPQAVQKAKSNVASVVRLAGELEQTLPVERRSLWSESGENFADRMDEALYDEAG